MVKYEPGVFLTLYQTALGVRLWGILNEHENIVRMKTATALGRPAVEGLEEVLLDKFGTQVLEDRVKQMIGHMVRQIMESNGYVVDAQNVKITNGGPFSRATRYKAANEMTFHVFRASKSPTMIALTADKEATLLQTDYLKKDTRWVYWKSFRGGLRGRIAFGLQDEVVARADIAEKGYHIYKLERLFRAAGVPST
jgi:hypothetical protein